MFTVCTEDYSLILQDRGLPSMADEYAKRAVVNDYFDSLDEQGGLVLCGNLTHETYRMALLDGDTEILAVDCWI